MEGKTNWHTLGSWYNAQNSSSTDLAQAAMRYQLEVIAGKSEYYNFDFLSGKPMVEEVSGTFKWVQHPFSSVHIDCFGADSTVPSQAAWEKESLSPRK